MANSSSYIVKTKNRCVVAVNGDSAGAITIGITGSAFTQPGGYPDFNDPNITNSSACLSRFHYGLSGSSCLLQFGGTTAGNAYVLTPGTTEVNFDRMTVPNNAGTPNGTFIVNVPASTVLTAYLEFTAF